MSALTKAGGELTTAQEFHNKYGAEALAYVSGTEKLSTAAKKGLKGLQTEYYGDEETEGKFKQLHKQYFGEGGKVESLRGEYFGEGAKIGAFDEEGKLDITKGSIHEEFYALDDPATDIDESGVYEALQDKKKAQQLPFHEEYLGSDWEKVLTGGAKAGGRFAELQAGLDTKVEKAQAEFAKSESGKKLKGILTALPESAGIDVEAGMKYGDAEAFKPIGTGIQQFYRGTHGYSKSKPRLNLQYARVAAKTMEGLESAPDRGKYITSQFEAIENALETIGTEKSSGGTNLIFVDKKRGRISKKHWGKHVAGPFGIGKVWNPFYSWTEDVTSKYIGKSKNQRADAYSVIEQQEKDIGFLTGTMQDVTGKEIDVSEVSSKRDYFWKYIGPAAPEPIKEPVPGTAGADEMLMPDHYQPAKFLEKYDKEQLWNEWTTKHYEGEITNEMYEEFQTKMEGETPEDWMKTLSWYKPPETIEKSSRETSGRAKGGNYVKPPSPGPGWFWDERKRDAGAGKWARIYDIPGMQNEWEKVFYGGDYLGTKAGWVKRDVDIKSALTQFREVDLPGLETEYSGKLKGVQDAFKEWMTDAEGEFTGKLQTAADDFKRLLGTLPAKVDDPATTKVDETIGTGILGDYSTEKEELTTEMTGEGEGITSQYETDIGALTGRESLGKFETAAETLAKELKEYYGEDYDPYTKTGTLGGALAEYTTASERFSSAKAAFDELGSEYSALQSRLSKYRRLGILNPAMVSRRYKKAKLGAGSYI